MIDAAQPWRLFVPMIREQRLAVPMPVPRLRIFRPMCCPRAYRRVAIARDVLRSNMRLLSTFLLLLLAILAGGDQLLAQRSRFDILTNGGQRVWRSASVESSKPGMSGLQLVLQLDASGRCTQDDGVNHLECRWELSDDATELVLTERRLGDLARPDTVWAEIVALSEDSLVLDYSMEIGRLHVVYLADKPDPNASDTIGFAAFYKQFQAAVAAGDIKRVAAFVHFPFFSHDLPGMIHKPTHSPEFTREEFMRYYTKLFDAEARMHIAKATPTPIDDGDGVRAFAVGIRGTKGTTIWVEFARTDVGVWGLVGTGNISTE